MGQLPCVGHWVDGCPAGQCSLGRRARAWWLARRHAARAFAAAGQRGSTRPASRRAVSSHPFDSVRMCVACQSGHFMNQPLNKGCPARLRTRSPPRQQFTASMLHHPRSLPSQRLHGIDAARIAVSGRSACRRRCPVSAAAVGCAAAPRMQPAAAVNTRPPPPPAQPSAPCAAWRLICCLLFGGACRARGAPSSARQQAPPNVCGPRRPTHTRTPESSSGWMRPGTGCQTASP